MICEKCGKEHDGSYGSGRFCSAFCARSFSSNLATDLYKPSNCVVCGKEITIKKRSTSKCMCDDCRRKSKIKTCKICGSKYYIDGNGNGCNNQFCKYHGLQQFNSLIKYFGFDKTKLGTPDVEEEFNRVRDILYNLYWNEHKSSKEISDMFGYPNQANLVEKLMGRTLQIETKDIRYALSENLSEGRTDLINTGDEYRYKSQWYTTWNGRKVFLRSSYELDYAKYLDSLNVDYMTEKLRIRYFDTQRKEDRCAIPDFYIPENNLIVEIKSSWTLDVQNMIDKKKSYLENGYNFKLICDHKEIEI